MRVGKLMFDKRGLPALTRTEQKDRLPLQHIGQLQISFDKHSFFPFLGT
jgi:hypothetical protein